MTDHPTSASAPPEPAGGASAPPATANSGAIAVIGLDLQAGRAIPRKQVISWALWDWATQPFNSVILTFIFASTLYLTGPEFLPPDIAALGAGDPAYDLGLATLASNYGWGGTIAGLFILLLAPVLGRQADAAGRQKLWLAVFTGLLIAVQFGLFFVVADAAFFWLGVGLIAAGSVFSEIAGVNYNAMIVSVATPKTIGRVSGLGWGLGYVGGIVALVLVVVFYSADWFGLDDSDGLPFRLIAIGCAIWAIVFVIPIFRNVPDPKGLGPVAEKRPGFFASYVLLVKDVIALYKRTETRPTFWFLLASAVFRDGLAGVFAYGAIIAGTVFGFGFLQLVIFGIAANLIAGVSTMIAGRFDDRFGARAIILFSLAGMLVAGFVVFFAHEAGTTVFWVFGLALCAFVGPAQAAARSFLARITPAGREGEIFGLYATTGRAASWMSSLLWAWLIKLGGAAFWGILGIMIVLATGFVLMLFVRDPRQIRPREPSISG